MQPGRQEGKGTHLFWIDLRDASCVETHKPMQGGMNMFVLPMTWSHQRTTLTLRQDGNEAETKTRGSSCWTLKVRMDLWINAMTTKKQRKLVTGCTKNMQQQQEMATQEFILEIKFEKDRNNNSKGHEDDFYRVDLETGWTYYLPATTTSSSSSSPWWQPSNSWWTACGIFSSWNEQ